MLEKLIKRTSVYKNMVNQRKENELRLTESLIKSEEAISVLRSENERLLASGAIPINSGNSSILFEFDSELNVTTKSRVNKDIVPVLIDNKYLDSTQSEDDAAIQLVFVLLANEVTEQIISEINDDAN